MGDKLEEAGRALEAAAHATFLMVQGTAVFHQLCRESLWEAAEHQRQTLMMYYEVSLDQYTLGHRLKAQASDGG